VLLLLALGAALALVLGALVGTVTLLSVALLVTLAEGELVTDAGADALGGALAVGPLVGIVVLAAVRLGAALGTGADEAAPDAVALGAPVVAASDADGRGVSVPGGVGLQEQNARLTLTHKNRIERLRKRGSHD
jgi:hypothetical protein